MLGRRNLDRADRDEMIRRLAARGVKQKDIVEMTKLDKSVVSRIVNDGKLQNATERNINATTPDAEIASKQAELDSLRKRLKDEQDERDTPGPITKNNVPEEFFAPLKGEVLHVATGRGSFLAGGNPLPVETKMRSGVL